MRKLNVALFALIVAFATACATLTKPESLDQRIAYAEGQVTAAYKTLADLAVRERISYAQAVETLDQIDTAAASLKAARIVVDAKPQEAVGYLQAATSILVSVETFLKAQE